MSRLISLTAGIVLIAGCGGVVKPDLPLGPAPNVAAPIARPRVVPAATPLPSEDAAIAAVQAGLIRRGFGVEVVAAPMSVWYPGEVGPIPEAERAHPAIGWADSALQVETAVGRWWVWDYGVIAPADKEALRLEAAQRAAGLLEGGLD